MALIRLQQTKFAMLYALQLGHPQEARWWWRLYQERALLLNPPPLRNKTSMKNCQRCALPIVEGDGPSWAPQCKCWANYTLDSPTYQKGKCVPALPLTEADVRRIVRDELKKAFTLT